MNNPKVDTFELRRRAKYMELTGDEGAIREYAHYAADEIDRLRNIISGIGLEYPLSKINTEPFRDAAKNYAMPDGQIREHLNNAADWIEDRDYMIELEQKAHAATKAELARMREGLEFISDGDPDFYGWFARLVLTNDQKYLPLHLERWKMEKGGTTQC